ncbi:hypothetical protein Q7C_646 [Methylophaga frappieri]|uniref:Uncharacterized protein n=1 Tax=Methylophaga frappieri (strain ATCC BAA-2434 / DSM 25690 / JAM7) TaxID=754477 RepID=I1YFX4_METFJ|nr:DUF58 domain-containing protein [Methylophaga frappieri]AFJ01817.1 hypothetical protein Q7C_646 [Methylophaga frappieri]
MVANTLKSAWLRLTTINGRRIYILPSRAGLGFAGLMLLMLLAAINYNNSLAYLLAFLLISLGHVAMHHSHRNIRTVTYQVLPPRPAFAGQNIPLGLVITTKHQHPVYQLLIDYASTAPPSRWFSLSTLARYQHVAVMPMVSDAESFSVPLPAMTRGWQTIRPLRIGSRYPLGLFYCWTIIRPDTQVLIYPAPTGVLPLPLSDNGNVALMAGTGQDDFAGFRKYHLGDPAHQIAWKALARDDVLRSKQYNHPEGITLQLDWQQVASLSETEARLSQLCQWVLAADEANMQYGLTLPTGHIEPDKGANHRHRCLSLLATYDR